MMLTFPTLPRGGHFVCYRPLSFARRAPREGGSGRTAEGPPPAERHEGRKRPMDKVSLYWKNATAEAVGDEHGVTEKELKQIAPQIKSLTKQMAGERKAGKLRYRD